MEIEVSMALRMRNGTSSDEDWLFELFRTTMQNYIDKAWGWDELLQREGFITSLPAKYFQILEANSVALGSYHLSDNDDHFSLDIIMVDPNQQYRGYGTHMINEIRNSCSNANKPVELSVLKTNPAVAFHRASGFQQVQEDEHSIRMRWTPRTHSR